MIRYEYGRTAVQAAVRVLASEANHNCTKYSPRTQYGVPSTQYRTPYSLPRTLPLRTPLVRSNVQRLICINGGSSYYLCLLLISLGNFPFRYSREICTCLFVPESVV